MPDIPVSLAIADLNDDRANDLSVVCESSLFVDLALEKHCLPGFPDSVLSLGIPVSYDFGYNKGAVAVADLNGDGKPDLAVTETTAGSAAILLGNGDGTFTESVEYLAGLNPTSIAIADLNGDHVPDIAVTDGLLNDVSLLMNRGAATVGVSPAQRPNPARFAVLPPYPNPSRSAMTLRFTLPSVRLVDAEVFDIAGRRVRWLVKGSLFSAGEHEVQWNHRDDDGALLPAGIYLIRIRAGGEARVMRAVVLH